MKILKDTLSLILSILISYLLVEFLLDNIISKYPRLVGMMARFPFTDQLLVGALTLIIWLGYVQWERKHLWSSYLYLSYSMYGCLLFIMLFTKAKATHAIILNPIDFFSWDSGILEAILNVITFIPLGVLYALRAKKWEMVFISLVTIIAIETTQYIFYLGVFSISDIICNFLGCLMGYYFYPVIKKHFAEEIK